MLGDLPHAPRPGRWVLHQPCRQGRGGMRNCAKLDMLLKRLAPLAELPGASPWRLSLWLAFHQLCLQAELWAVCAKLARQCQLQQTGLSCLGFASCASAGLLVSHRPCQQQITKWRSACAMRRFESRRRNDGCGNTVGAVHLKAGKGLSCLPCASAGHLRHAA